VQGPTPIHPSSPAVCAVTVSTVDGKAQVFPQAAVVLTSLDKNIAAKPGFSGPGRSYAAQLLVRGGATRDVQVALWGTVLLRQEVLLGTPYVVTDARLTGESLCGRIWNTRCRMSGRRTQCTVLSEPISRSPSCCRAEKEQFGLNLSIGCDSVMLPADPRQFASKFSVSVSPDAAQTGDAARRRIKGGTLLNNCMGARYLKEEQTLNVHVAPDDNSDVSPAVRTNLLLEVA
jgi:hypothetical protein